MKLREASPGQIRKHRPRGNIGSRDPLIRAIFERARELELSDLDLSIISGYNLSMIGEYRRGDLPANRLTTARDLANAVGLELTLKEKEE